MSTLERLAAPAADATGTAPAVRIRGLVKSYGDFRAVDGIDLDVRTGEVFGLLGPNGAGKTTTIDCVVGLRRPTEGSVRVLGMDPAVDRAGLTARVAVQPQEASLFDTLTVAETLRLFASLHAAPRGVAEICEEVGLTEKAGARVKKLSGGQRRRLLLAVALIGDPDVVLLDEPSAGLDPAARQSLWGLIAGLRDRGTTVLLTTHHMDEASALCDRVAIVVDGRVTAVGAPDELVRRRSTRRVTFTVAAGTDLSGVGRLDAVQDVTTSPRHDGVRVAAATDDPDGVLRSVAVMGDLAARDLTVESQTLEDVFLALADTSTPESRDRRTTRTGRRNR